MVLSSSRLSAIVELFKAVGRSARAGFSRTAKPRKAVGGRAIEPLESRRLLAAQPTLQLIDADTDRVVATMTDGMTIDLSTVGSRLNVNAVTDGKAASVSFLMDNKWVVTEGIAPYAIGGDVAGDFKAWTPSVGAHKLQAVQYSKANGVGTVLAQKTVNFTVVGSGSTPTPAPSPTPGAGPALKLINAATDQVISSLTSGATINLSSTGSSLSISATPSGAGRSVVFKLDGAVVQTESSAPYAIAGDDFGNFNPWTPSAGSHTVEAIVYSGTKGLGSVLGRTSAAFTVVGAPTTPPPTDPGEPLPSGGGGGEPGGTVNGGSPVAVIGVVGQSGMAGHPTVVNAVNSRLPNSPIRATYQWNFGDAAGAYNTLGGWTAGHIYDRPGNYAVRLTVTDANGNSSSTTTIINVAGDSRRTVYVDAQNGNDGNAGTIGSPIRSYAKASQYANGSNVRVLFKRGQTWNTNQWMSITGHNVVVGAYGTGAKPVLNVVSGLTAIQSFASSSNVVIENLTFDSPYKAKGNTANKNGVNGIFVGGTQVAVRGCTFLNVTDGMNANQKPHGFIAQDNDAPLATGIRGYLLWVEGSDVVALGNSAANSTREHTMRIWHVDRILAAYNNFTNLDRGKVDRQDIAKGTIEVQTCSWAYVYGNTLRGGPLRVGPRGTAVESRSTRSSYVVLENNKSYGYQINVYAGSQHLMIRNNVIYNDNEAGIAINARDDEGRTLSDINIIGNTVYDNGTVGNFLHTTTGLLNGTITLGKNTFVAPHLISGRGGAGAMFIAENNLSGFKSIYNNVWPIPQQIIKYAQGGMTWVAPTFSGQAGFKDPREWAAYPQVHGDIFKRM